ncbi:hypothetical protein EVAR_32719_1 [Eumeta japonica]|uniref:Uncharacterized protein n=1 Tax=Eumeta variegata TaxID=151549 RepID=A0A4C1ZAS7_EUMVA|nr:hypothetical protein EVAR_32719_1 [Eumeta japonica]
MYFAFFTHQLAHSRIFHTPFFASAVSGRRTYDASCPGVFSSGIPPRRSSVGTPILSSTVTAISGSDGEVAGRHFVQTGEIRRWRTSTVRKNYDDHLLPRISVVVVAGLLHPFLRVQVRV